MAINLGDAGTTVDTGYVPFSVSVMSRFPFLPSNPSRELSEHHARSVPASTDEARTRQRACASKNIGTRKSGVPTYRIRSRQLLRIHRVFFGAVTGTAGTVCGRENALRSCIGLSGKCLLIR